MTRIKVDIINESERLIVREVQNVYYRVEMSALRNKEPLPKDSCILDLLPKLDSHGILRVGGRLTNARLDTQVMNPIILPGKSHVATLLVRHFHELNYHQGRHYTEAAIRSNGFWVTGCKRLINTLLHKCIMCQKLRAKSEYQQMADLPSDRVNPAPPFTFVAGDTFGPWQVAARRTKGGLAQSKRYAVMFTCLVIRAVHIEVMEELTSSCFINALRRFVSIQGPVKEFRSDRGTNFVGSVNELGIEAINVEDPPIANYLLNNKIVWKFSSPQSSHMNGAVER